MLEHLFDKVVNLKACNFINYKLQYSYFPVNIAKFLRSAFNTSRTPPEQDLCLSIQNQKRQKKYKQGFSSTKFTQLIFFKISQTVVKLQKQPLEEFCKKRCSHKFRKFRWKHLCLSLFLIKLPAFSPATLLKIDSNTGVSCEIREIFKNTYFEKYPRMTTFKVTKSS